MSEENNTNKTNEKEVFNKQEWADKKIQIRKDVYDLIDKTALLICKDSSKFRAFLDVQSIFDRYSVGNALLITAQKPNSTVLKDYNGWKDCSAHIKEGEKSIYILEPGDKYKGKDGSSHVYMNVKNVFDISQTSEISKKTIIKKYDDRSLIKALISKIPVEIEPLNNTFTLETRDKAFYNPEKNTIYVRENLEIPQLFRSLSKELAMADFMLKTKNFSRPEKNFKAICVAYILSKKFGVDTKDMEIRVPASYVNKTPQEVREDLNEIREQAISMISRIDCILEHNQNKSINQREEAR